MFNYRLSRARRIVENTFGILSSMFRILLRTLELNVHNVIQVVCACLAHHNFLMEKRDPNYAPAGYLDSEDEHGQLLLGAWRRIESATNNLAGHPSDRPSTLKARDVRDDMKDYFFEEGAVNFQWKMTE